MAFVTYFENNTSISDINKQLIHTERVLVFLIDEEYAEIVVLYIPYKQS